MIELTGLNGAKLLIAPRTIFRVRSATPSEGAEAVKVEYGGGYIFTLEPIDSLLVRLATEVRLVRLTTRSGTTVFLNRDAVSRVRDALPINGAGTEILIAGMYQHVVERLDDVMAVIG